MAYIRISTQTYHLSERDIREAHPNTSFADPFVSPDDYSWVFPTPQPTHDPISQAAREIAPAVTDKGIWEQQWEVVARFADYTDAEGVTHTAADQLAAAVEADRLSKVPQSVEMVQARLALLGAGISASMVDALIAAMPSPQREVAQIEWEFRATVRRSSDLVKAMAAALHLTDRQVDDLFITAATH